MLMYKPDSLPIDEELVQFTDRFLKGDISEVAEGDAELVELTEIVQRLYTAFDEEIDANKAEAIRRKVKANWLLSPNLRKRSKPKRKNWFSWTNQRYFRTAASVAMLLVLIVLTPILLTNVPFVVGSAGVFTQKTLFYAVLGLLLVVILIWILRKK